MTYYGVKGAFISEDALVLPWFTQRHEQEEGCEVHIECFVQKVLVRRAKGAPKLFVYFLLFVSLCESGLAANV
jgi:hypothetical protein